jgi:transcription elongation GreA/GreB family factor
MLKPNWPVVIANMNLRWAVEIEEKLQQHRERLRVLLGPRVAKLRQETEQLAQLREKRGDHAAADELRQMSDELLARFG